MKFNIPFRINGILFSCHLRISHANENMSKEEWCRWVCREKRNIFVSIVAIHRFAITITCAYGKNNKKVWKSSRKTLFFAIWRCLHNLFWFYSTQKTPLFLFCQVIWIKTNCLLTTSFVFKIAIQNLQKDMRKINQERSKLLYSEHKRNLMCLYIGCVDIKRYFGRIQNDLSRFSYIRIYRFVAIILSLQFHSKNH